MTLSRPLKIALLLLVLAGAVFGVVRLRAILMPVLLAVVIVYLTLPLVELLEGRKVPRPVAIVIVYVFLVVVGSLSALYLLPPFLEEVDRLVANLPQQTYRIERVSADLHEQLRKMKLPGVIKSAADDATNRVESEVRGFARKTVETVMALLSKAYALILAPVIAYYITRDLDGLKMGFLNLVPLGSRAQALSLLKDVDMVLSGFFRGQLLVGLAVGGLSSLGLFLLGIPYALLIGLLAGLFDIIPYFGPIIGALPAVLLGLERTPLTAFWVVVMFIGVHQLEGAILSPRIIGDRVGLHPLVVIVAVLAGAELAGITGMLLGVPVVAVVRVLGAHAYHYLVSART